MITDVLTFERDSGITTATVYRKARIMIKSLDDYRQIVGDDAIAEIYTQARRLQGRRVLHINSTHQGGGVAEILSSLVPLMNDVGVEADWRVLHGTPDFFAITKKFHNALQGGSLNLTDIKKQLCLPKRD